MQVRYGYGIDLAETLNYCGIVVTKITNRVEIQTLRKFNKKSYPQIRQLLVNDLLPRFPPSYIAIDYTSEKSFSEELENVLNPLFTLDGSPDYQKWKYVMPIVFNQSLKLEMKQNARYMIENGLFVTPQREGSPHEIWNLWDELYSQLFREVADPTSNGLFKFPKPQGFDNDLAMAFELNLLGAKNLIGEMSGEVNRESIVMTYSDDEAYPNKVNTILDNPRVQKHLKHLGSEIGIEIDGKTINKKDVAWLN